MTESDPSVPSDSRFQRVEALFNAVCDLTPDQAARYLDTHCPDAGERAEVESLLGAEGGAEQQLSSIVPDALNADAVQAADAMIGQTLGAWRLESTLGHGGMGTVYRAERIDGEYSQTAALKLMRDIGPSRELSARFIAERQILARLDHPGIARLLDGAAPGTARPGWRWSASTASRSTPGVRDTVCASG